jgi:hypothetical protein
MSAAPRQAFAGCWRIIRSIDGGEKPYLQTCESPVEAAKVDSVPGRAGCHNAIANLAQCACSWIRHVSFSVGMD